MITETVLQIRAIFQHDLNCGMKLSIEMLERLKCLKYSTNLMEMDTYEMVTDVQSFSNLPILSS